MLTVSIVLDLRITIDRKGGWELYNKTNCELYITMKLLKQRFLVITLAEVMPSNALQLTSSLCQPLRNIRFTDDN
jgi:hypothetical protein